MADAEEKKYVMPLKMFELPSILVFISFYSPVILAAMITSMSFIFQNFKGFIYLGWLLAFVVIRQQFYRMSGIEDDYDGYNAICSSIEFVESGNKTFSSYIFAYTITYITIPMFLGGGNPNWFLFACLISYFVFDFIIKFSVPCIKQSSDYVGVFLNILSGVILAATAVTVMYMVSGTKYLFSNEVTTGGAGGQNMCYMPSKQQFLCKVKNGVGETVAEFKPPPSSS